MKTRQWLDAFELVHAKRSGARKVNEHYQRTEKPECCVVLRVRDRRRWQKKIAAAVSAGAGFPSGIVTQFERDVADHVLEALGFPKVKR